VSQYQKGKTNLDFSEARDNEWQRQRLDHMQVCTSLQTDNHANTSLLSFLQAGCPSCHPTNSVKALKAHILQKTQQTLVLTDSRLLYLSRLCAPYTPGHIAHSLDAFTAAAATIIGSQRYAASLVQNEKPLESCKQLFVQL